MKITKETERELIAHLKKGSVSIPELQLDMKLSYKEARSLIEYATDHIWIGDCEEGNEYPAISKRFTHKTVPKSVCKSIYDTLDTDDLKVLCYIDHNFSATLTDILNNVDDDKEDMRSALNSLMDKALIFKNENNYYCRLSRKAVKLIKQGENENDTDSTLQKVLHNLS